MDQASLAALISEWRARLKAGQTVEDPKVELKRAWPKLAGAGQDERTISEFLKDLVAIANTPGLTGYLIYGIDGKTGDLHEAALSQSGLRDQSELRGLVVKHVTRPVNFEVLETAVDGDSGKVNISVIAVRPSLDKPHVIGRYVPKSGQPIQNFVPVRKSTGIFPADKHDFEFMFYDRKNVEPEYALRIVTLDSGMIVNSRHTKDIRAKTEEMDIHLQVAFENYGRRPIAVTESHLVLEPHGLLGMIRPCSFHLDEYKENAGQPRVSIRDNWIIVPSNQIRSVRAWYMGWGPETLCNKFNDLGKDIKFSFSITAKDLVGNEYQTKGAAGSAQMASPVEY
jgi:hypothetical protein